MFFPKTHIFSFEEIVEYVKHSLDNNTLIREFEKSGDYGADDYLERQHFMVPNRFHFLVMDGDNWADKIYHFSFLNYRYKMLQYSNDKPYYDEIEQICYDAPNYILAGKESSVLPSRLKPGIWTLKDEIIIRRKLACSCRN